MIAHKSNIFLSSSLAFILGVGFASFLYLPGFVIGASLLASLVLVIFFWGLTSARLFTLPILFFVLGIGRYFLSVPIVNQSHVLFYVDQEVNIQGRVVTEVDRRINSQRLTLGELTISGRPLSGRVQVKTLLYPKYKFGDQLKVHCSLVAPEPFNGFAYDRYLARRHVYALCFNTKVNLVKSQPTFFFSKLLTAKGYLKRTINRNLPEPQASLLQAMVLGSRRGVPSEVIENFSASGLVHLVAISGLHITIIITVLMNGLIFLGLWRRQAFWAITIGLIIYVALIGFPSSAVRASVMGWTLLLATQTGRVGRPVRAIVLAATLMLLINPKLLRDDTGFQLSFLATLGIGWLSPWLEEKLQRMPELAGTRQALGMTLAAQITTLPLVVLRFGRLSLVGPLANILVLPVIPWLLMSSGAALALSWLPDSIGQILFWPSFFILKYITLTTEWLSVIPFGSIVL